MKNLALLFVWALLATQFPQAVKCQQSISDLDIPLSIDPAVKIGKLENGLVYYIRQNKKPENRVELRLVVNAGSILENNDQQGLAHFIEHMNFNGTKTFPKNDLIDFLQKTGVRFGADINAYTGFDETVYMLQLPTDEVGLVEKGYQVLEDWAHNALLEGSEIDKERGIIIEEWRLGLGAQDRMMKKIFPVIFKDSRYSLRIPIGKVEIIESFKHKTLRDFYTDWYRPDLMAVVVVGDIDPNQAESKIKEHFSRLKNPSKERERTTFDLPDNVEPLISIATDKEATNNIILMFYKHPFKVEKNVGDIREQLTAELFNGMLNQRLNELGQNPESPFIFASTRYGKFLTRSKDAYAATALAKENQIDQCLGILLQENERVKRYGFTPTEFERQKLELFSLYEKDAKEFDKSESASFAASYVSNFLIKDPIPGSPKMFKYVKKLLPDIKLEEINALSQKWVTDKNLAIAIMAPDKEGVKVPTTQDLLDLIKQSKFIELKPYVDSFKAEPLISTELKGGKVIERKENRELNFTELTLDNGVQLILKSTAFKNDEILISAYSPGGSSLASDNEFISANYASQVIDMSGLGNFDNVELQKKLKGKNLEISPYIDDVKEGFRGNSAPKDLETTMQLIYLYFKCPRKDTTAFKTFISQQENQMKFMKSNPVMTFYDTLFKTVYPGYKRMVIFPTPQQLQDVDLDILFRIYSDRFADASDFRFFMVGNFSIDSIIPLIEKYFGSLPSTNRKETWKDTSPKFADGKTNLTFNKGSDPQSMVGIVMSEKFDWNEKNLVNLRLLNEILNIKLVEVIREKLSGVYSPQVALNYDQYPKSTLQLIIMFGCSPTMTDSLSQAVFGEIQKIRQNGPTEVDLKKAQEACLRSRETDLEKNEFWLSKLESIYYNHENPASVLTYKDRVNAVTIEDLKNTSNALFNPENYVRVVLMPEKK